MALNSTHPQYDAFIDYWLLMQDSYAGEAVVKARTTTYLPATQSQVIDGYGSSAIATEDNIGHQNYMAYKLRAQFPDYVKDAVEMGVGLMHQKDAVIELPEAMEGLRENATLQGESLLNVLRRINESQLASGRIAILGDLPSSPDQTDPLPYLALYNTIAIINWDTNSQDYNNDTLNLVVLNESGSERQSSFEWKDVKKYRVLVLSKADEVKETITNPTSIDANQSMVYMFGTFRDTETFSDVAMQVPTIRGVSSEEIPFVFINTKDVVPQPDFPPLLGLATLSMSIYRSEADYRQALFMQGQDTLVIIGSSLDENGTPDNSQGTRTGAGAVLSVDVNCDAKFIGVESAGLEEQRKAIENDRKLAATKTIQVSSNDGSDAESGKARKIRVAAETANLNQVALTGAAGLQKELRILAKWMGADPEQVIVTPNLDFTMEDLDSRSLVEIMTAKNMGAPISMESIHQIARERGLTSLGYEDEKKLFEQDMEDAANRIPQGTQVGGDPEPNLNDEGDQE